MELKTSNKEVYKVMIEEDAILKSLKRAERFDEYNEINIWIPDNECNINFYVFYITLEDEEELEKVWSIIVNDIAYHVQTELVTEIEQWNMYLFFFIKQSVSKRVKYKIEQDRYSLRKIVIDGVGDTICHRDHVIFRVSELLFDFKYEQVLDAEVTNIGIKTYLDSAPKWIMELVEKGNISKPGKAEVCLDDYLKST